MMLSHVLEPQTLASKSDADRRLSGSWETVMIYNSAFASDLLGDIESTLDWTVLADPTRSAIVEGLDRTALARSATLQRVVDLAAAFAESKFAQISLIGDAQYVPVAHGVAPSMEGTPIPDSLCSVTMAAGKSVIIGDASTHAWVRDLPPVASGEVGSYLGVPLRNSNGVMLGALCVYDDHTTVWPNHLAGALEDLLTFAATEIEQIATINAQEHSLEQLTNAIQHIVAPPPMAVPCGIDIVGRYRSANVGGDLYEWTPVDDTTIAITIGDVSGHGLVAVANMTRLKAHVHAYLLEGHEPGDTLRLASKAFENSGQMATVLDARYRPADRLLTYASAGHVPPLVLRDSGAFFAELQPGPPLGFGLRAPRKHSLVLEFGDTVLLCTDGLYEQRRTTIDDSLEDLRQRAMSAVRTALTLDDLADALLHIPLSDTNDDACLMALRPQLGG